MLHYFRETQQARKATRARRIYNYASAAVLLAVAAWTFVVLAPAWIFWAVFAASFVLDAFLARKWVRDDALIDYWASQTR